jgi:hypothetical protein
LREVEPRVLLNCNRVYDVGEGIQGLL